MLDTNYSSAFISRSLLKLVKGTILRRRLVCVRRDDGGTVGESCRLCPAAELAEGVEGLEDRAQLHRNGVEEFEIVLLSVSDPDL